MKHLCVFMALILCACTGADKDSWHITQPLPQFPPDVNLSEYALDSLHKYGAGDCFGTVRRYSGPSTIVIDSLTCSEYSFRYAWYWLDDEGKVYRSQESTWQSVLNATWDDYVHIYAETVHIRLDNDSLIAATRADTLESHYLLTGRYPGPLDKEFEPGRPINLDSILTQTWRLK